MDTFFNRNTNKKTESFHLDNNVVSASVYALGFSNGIPSATKDW